MAAIRIRAFALVATLLVLPLLAPPARADDASLARGALAWLAGQSAFAPYRLEAAAAMQRDGAAWPSAGAPILRAVASYQSAFSGLEGAERAAHAIGVDGYDPRAADGRDLVAEIRAGFDGAQFGDPTLLNDDAWAILALRAAGVPADDSEIQAAANTISVHRLPDGGWDYAAVSTSSDTDATGAALAALRAAGRDVAGDASSRFLAKTAAPGGGHSEKAAGSPNCQSTAWAIHAETLLGLSTDADLGFLRTLVNGDGGLGIDPGSASDVQCTAEAAVALAGARYPLAGLAPATLSVPSEVTRASACSFSLDGPLDTVSWRTPWGSLSGASHTVTASNAGTFELFVEARGDHTVFRRHVSLRVDPIPPTLVASTEEITARRGELVALDAVAIADTGRTARVWVEWGEGNATTLLGHAYATPGARRVHVWAVDDLGTRGGDAWRNVTVVNREPAWGRLPENLTVDRLWSPPARWNATDPDGDALTFDVRWSGNGTLGPRTLGLVARDPWGAQNATNLTVLVIDDAPTLGAPRLPTRALEGDAFTFAIDARDPDGPAPEVTWRFGDRVERGVSGSLALPAGDYDVQIDARDAEGLVATQHAALRVDAAPRRAPASHVPPTPAPTPAGSQPLGTAAVDAATPAAPAPAPAPLVTALAPLAPAPATPTPADPTMTPSPAAHETPAPAWPWALAALLLARRKRAA